MGKERRIGLMDEFNSTRLLWVVVKNVIRRSLPIVEWRITDFSSQ